MFKFLQRKNIDPKAQLQKVLGDYELPTFPVIAQQVMEKIRDPEVSIASVSELIEKDPGLSMGVLRTVNSVAFSPRKRVDNLKQAVAMMGLSPLESLILSTSVGKMLPKTSSDHHSPREFWLASSRRAAVARAIASEVHPSTVNLSYTAALLQDMAVPFLAEKKPEEHGRVLDQWHNGDDDLANLERNEFGWDHAEVATWICDQWGVPESLAAAIGGHHGADVDGFEVPPAVALVSCIRETQENPGIDRLVEVAKSRYGMNPDRVAESVQTGFEAAEELASLFS